MDSDFALVTGIIACRPERDGYYGFSEVILPAFLKYRFCLHRGNAQSARLAQRFAAYAATSKVTLGQVNVEREK